MQNKYFLVIHSEGFIKHTFAHSSITATPFLSPQHQKPFAKANASRHNYQLFDTVNLGVSLFIFCMVCWGSSADGSTCTQV